jgi:hypothetical protein
MIVNTKALWIFNIIQVSVYKSHMNKRKWISKNPVKIIRNIGFVRNENYC